MVRRWIYRKGRPVEVDSDREEPPDVPLRAYVYIAAPYSLGDAFANVRGAIDIAEILRAKGYQVFVPHLFAFWNFIHPHSWQEWMALDLAWLERCDVLFRVPGESLGAEWEVERARELGIPVVASLEELEAWCAAPPTEDVGHGGGANGAPEGGGFELAPVGA